MQYALFMDDPEKCGIEPASANVSLPRKAKKRYTRGYILG